MELSSLLQQHNIPLTKAERAFFSGLKSSGGSRSDEFYEQQLKRLAEAREALKQLPDKKTSERQKNAEKIKMLKERLRMLKQMIPFMSTSAAKSLKAELRQIAAQIASLTGSSGSSGSSGGSSAGTQAAADTAESAAADTGTAVSETAVQAASEGSENHEQTEAEGEPAEADSKEADARKDSYLEQANQSRADAAADRAEKEELEKLKQLYQAVKNMLERKLQKPDDPATQAALQLQAYQAAAETIKESDVSVSVSFRG